MNKNHDHDDIQMPEHCQYSFIKMAKSRSIFFSEVVTKQAAAELSALMLYYDNIDHEEPISLYINTPGGSVYAGLAIYDISKIQKYFLFIL